MNISLSAIEVIMLTLQVVLIPFAKFYLDQYKEQTLQRCKDMILEHYTGLSDLYDHNREKISLLESNMSHKLEIDNLNYRTLKNHLNDIEIYLEKNNGFVRRSCNQD